MSDKEREYVIEGELTSRSFYVRIYASSAEEAEKMFWFDNPLLDDLDEELEEE